MRWRRQALVSLVSLGLAAPAFAQAAKAGASAAVPSAKVDVNAPDAQGTPPLHWAVRLDDVAKVRSLLSAGADPHALTPDGRTARDLAAAADHALVLEILGPT